MLNWIKNYLNPFRVKTNTCTHNFTKWEILLEERNNYKERIVFIQQRRCNNCNLTEYKREVLGL